MSDLPAGTVFADGPGAASEVLAKVRSVSAQLAQAAAGEPASLAEPALRMLEQAGCMRMLLDPRYGGLGLSWPQTLAVVEELAVLDGSMGWRVGQVAQAHNILGCFPAATRDEVLARPGVRLAGSVAPKGRAAVAGATLRVTGQWPFVTGAPVADWFYLNCLELEGRSIALDDDDRPLTRLALLPAAQVQLLDTWHVLGLRATESCDVKAAAAEVDATLSFSLDPRASGNGVILDTFARSGLIVAACALGIARGAFTDLLAIAHGGRRPTFALKRLGDSPVFQHDVGELAVTLRAASALLGSLAHDPGGGVIQRAELRAATARVAESALQVVEASYRAAGGPAVYDGSALQQRLRDAFTAAQHVVAGASFYQPYGALLTCGQAETSF